MDRDSIKNKKDYIIETTFNLFLEKGYDNVTVNDICDRCNITKPTFYRNIGSKDALLSAFYDRSVNEIGTDLLQTVVGDNYWEQICKGFEIILNRSSYFGVDLYSQLYIANFKKDVNTFKSSGTIGSVMSKLFTMAQLHGQIRNSTNPYDLYVACSTMAFGYGITWCLGRGSFNLVVEFQKALENVCDVPQEYRIKLDSK